MGCRDFISNLPDDILDKILSLLPTKLVVSTSVLSKRWRNLFLVVDKLDLGPENEPPKSCGISFYFFLKRNFSRNRPIKEFSLNWRHGDYSNLWIHTALARGCLGLHLQCQLPRSLDFSLFSTNKLVKLTLSHGIHLSDRSALVQYYKPATFPTLKTLSLGAVVMKSISYESLIAYSCPVLEELFICNTDDYPSTWEGCVSSKSIKRLAVSVVSLPDDKEHRLSVVRFNAPNLVYLDYSCYDSRYYNVADLHSLVEARLDIRFLESTTIDHDEYDSIWDDRYGDVTDFVAGISNIKTLHLSPNSLEVFHRVCKSMPIFNNLLRLSIESDKEKGWQIVPLVLKSSPNLQTLVIKGLVHKVTDRCGDACPCMEKGEEMSCLWTCQVKVLEISGYEGTCQELKQMKHFLGKLQYLETVKIGLRRGNNNYLGVTNDLKKLSRDSPSCQMHFF